LALSHGATSRQQNAHCAEEPVPAIAIHITAMKQRQCLDTGLEFRDFTLLLFQGAVQRRKLCLSGRAHPGGRAGRIVFNGAADVRYLLLKTTHFKLEGRDGMGAVFTRLLRRTLCPRCGRGCGR